MKTKQTTAAASSETFAGYNEGKLTVRDGLVHLLGAGWAEYAPTFSAAGLTLRDKMPLEEFKKEVRISARVAIKANDILLEAELCKLATPNEDKQFIRELLAITDTAKTQSHASTTAKIIQFPSRLAVSPAD